MNSNDRANLIKRVNTLEGLTDKERSALLGLLRENKTYGLVWEYRCLSVGDIERCDKQNYNLLKRFVTMQ